MAQKDLNLNIKLAAKVATLERDLKRAKGKVDGFARNAAKSLAGILGGAALTSKFSNLVSQIDKATDATNRLGGSVSDLSRLQNVAFITGVNVNKLELGLQRMVRRVAEAGKGTGDARNALRELGIDAAKIAKMDPADLFNAIAKAMQGVAAQSDRLRLGFKLFDSEGADLIRIFALSAEQLKELNDLSDRTGATFDEKLVTSVSDFVFVLRKSIVQITGFANRVLKNVLPVLRTMLDLGSRLVDVFTSVDKVFKGWLSTVVTLSASVIALNQSLKVLGGLGAAIGIGGAASKGGSGGGGLIGLLAGIFGISKLKALLGSLKGGLAFRGGALSLSGIAGGVGAKAAGAAGGISAAATASPVMGVMGVATIGGIVAKGIIDFFNRRQQATLENKFAAELSRGGPSLSVMKARARQKKMAEARDRALDVSAGFSTGARLRSAEGEAAIIDSQFGIQANGQQRQTQVLVDIRDLLRRIEESSTSVGII